MIALQKLALALAVTLALASQGHAADSSQKLSDETISRNLDKVDTSSVSRWKYEVGDWPQESQCGGFWLRLDAAISGKSLTLKEFDDKQKAAKIFGQAEAQVLRKLSSRLHARKSPPNQLADFLDNCISQGEGHSAVDGVAVTPTLVDASTDEQSGDLVKLQAELAEVREQLKLERTTNEQLLANNKQLKLELEATKEDFAREKSVLSSRSATELRNLQAEMGEQVKLALESKEQLRISHQQLQDFHAELADQLRVAEKSIQDMRISHSYTELKLHQEIEQASKQLEKMQFTLAANKSELKNCREDTKLSKDAKSIIKDMKERNEDLAKAFKHSAKELSKSQSEAKKCEKKLVEMKNAHLAVLNAKTELEARLYSTQNNNWQGNYAVPYY